MRSCLNLIDLYGIVGLLIAVCIVVVICATSWEK